MNIDEFVELSSSRRSIRRFKPDPVSDEIIEKILEAARWAMSGANGQPWEFIVVKDPETRNKLAEAKIMPGKMSTALESIRVKELRMPYHRAEPEISPQVHFQVAPVIIVVCGDPLTAQASVLNTVATRRWIVDENMANVTYAINLAAAAAGLGAQWVSVNWLYEQYLKPILGVPPSIRIFNMVPIGYPAYTPKPTFRRDLAEITHYEKYDMSKYRSPDDVREFIRQLRERSKSAYPLK
ncbi:MAG: nitroreductase family protein [Desulfobacterales bacterium]|nr:nitroreductase family protein [Desulfobacterales bacterium]